MNWSFRFIDVSKSLQQKRYPEDFISRKDSKHWLYLSKPIVLEDPSNLNSWLLVKSGEAIRVPLFPYDTTDQDPVLLAALSFQLGVMAIKDWLTDHISDVHVTVADTLEEADDKYRLWLGIAIKVNDD